jgi:hypothetical protein
VESVGVKVTPWLEMPSAGAVAGVVKAKAPATLAVPPLSVEFASVWPIVIFDAVGVTLIIGVAWVMFAVVVETEPSE